MAKAREPKTIDEAITFLTALLPSGWSLSIHVHYYALREAGRMGTSRSFIAHLTPSAAREYACSVEGHDPASLCRAAVAALRARCGPPSLPAPAIAGAKPRRPTSMLAGPKESR